MNINNISNNSFCGKMTYSGPVLIKTSNGTDAYSSKESQSENVINSFGSVEKLTHSWESNYYGERAGFDTTCKVKNFKFDTDQVKKIDSETITLVSKDGKDTMKLYYQNDGPDYTNSDDDINSRLSTMMAMSAYNMAANSNLDVSLKAGDVLKLN